MSTNPVLVPISLVSQFLATEKIASRHWLQCQMECLLDQVFDQLSTKFEDYLASNAITDTAHHTTIDTDHIQHQLRHEPSFQAYSYPQFRATTDHLIDAEFPVVGQSHNQMMDVNGQMNGIHSEALMFNQAQFPYSLSVPTSNLDQSDQNDENGECGLGGDYQIRTEDIDDAGVNNDEMDVKEEIDDSHDQLITTDLPHSSSVLTSNIEQSSQNDNESGANEQPPNYDYASLVNNDEIDFKEEIDETNNELIITSDQNSHLSQPVFASASNEQLNHNWTSDNDEEYDLDGTRNDEQPSGLENGDIDDDAQMDSDEVEVKEEIDDTNNELFTTEQSQNPYSPVPALNVDQSNKKYNEYGLNDDDDRLPIQYLRDGNDDDNEINEKPSWHRKKPRLEVKQPNNRQSSVTRQSMRLVNSNQADQDQHINQQSNFDRSQSNEQTEPADEAEETNKLNIPDKQFITLNVQCLHTGCSLIFNNKTDLNAHMSTQHDILPHRCLFKDCKQSFSNKHNLGEHVKQVHSTTTRWHCDKCTKQFSTHRILAQHNYFYHQLGLYKCSFSNCTFTCEHRQKVFDHYKQHKPSVEFTCQQANCGRRFNNNVGLKRHQHFHLGIKPYRCKWPACGYAATQRSNTIDHIRRRHLKQGSTETSLVDPRNYLEVVR